MKAIHPKNYSILCVLVDDEDYERLVIFDWYVSNESCVVRFVGNQSIRISHEVLQIVGHNKLIDHIDRNYLNNKKINLREVTVSQNNHNRCKLIRVTGQKKISIYNGVSWNRVRRKWKVGIRKDKKQIHIGYFIDEVEAAIAYDKKSAELFGKFASLNFV